MERIEYDSAWLDEMRQKENVMNLSRVFRDHEEESLRVFLDIVCQPEDVLRELNDVERQTRIAFEDALAATGLMKRAKVAFGGFSSREGQPVTSISVWLVPSVPWEAFAYWAEDGLDRRNGVLVALGCALRGAFGADVNNQFFTSQLVTLGEMLSLAHDFPFLLSDLNQVDMCEIDTFEGSAVFNDIIWRSNCSLESCSLELENSVLVPYGILGYPAWHHLVNMLHSGYSRRLKLFFKEEREILEVYKEVERSLEVFRSSPRGGKVYAIDFEVEAVRPSFSFLVDPGQSDRVATLERGLVDSGFCHSASFSAGTLAGVAADWFCVVHAVVDAPGKEVAVDMPFAFHRAIVDTFQQTCGCWVVGLRQHGFPGASLLFGEEEY